MNSVLELRTYRLCHSSKHGGHKFMRIKDCNKRLCEVGTVGTISDCQPEGSGFNPRPGQGLNFG